MNYYKIKIELERRGIAAKDFCRQINVTEQGLHQMIRNESMKVDVLERISTALNLPVSYWFDVGKNVSSESETTNLLKENFSAKQIDLVTNELNKLLKDLSRAN